MTIADVAAAANVSAMTVSRVLNRRSGVGDEVRAKVEQAITALNYTRNSAARSLASAEMARIGVLYDRPSGAYLSELLIGLLDEASRSGHQLLLQRCDDHRQVARAIDTLLDEGVDGVVVAPPLSDLDHVFAQLAQAGKPAVAIGADRRDEGASVRIDDHAAAYAMTRHLIALGHREIAFVSGDPVLRASLARKRGYREAIDAAGLPLGPIVQGDFSYRSGIAAGLELFGRAVRPTAVFASNDDMAAAIATIAHRQRLDIPADVSVVGFDDTIIATTTWPELTTMRQPVAEMARTAMEQLTGALRSRSFASRAMILAHRLVRRESDASPTN